MSTIELKNVSKKFGTVKALEKVSVTFEPGKIYGLLGRNGAGKTTLINIITNRLFADSGEVLVDGEPAAENSRAQSKIYCMTEKNVHPWNLRVRDGLKWAREFNPGFDAAYAGTLAEKFKLDVNKRIRSLSSGYSSIFKLILTLASGVPVIIFDEPVLVMDAFHRELFYRELITYYSEHRQTVIIATHLIDEVAEILENVVILKEGEVVFVKPVESILQLAYTVSGSSAEVDEFSRGKNVIREETIGKLKLATVFQPRDSNDKARLQELGLEVSPAKLQEVFVSLTASREGQ